jgi:Protein of unknown function (DUF2530)
MDAQPDEPAGVEPPSVEAVDVDGVRAVEIGIIAWAVAFVVVAVTGHRGEPLGICAVGVGGGLAALAYVLRRRSVYRRAGR